MGHSQTNLFSSICITLDGTLWISQHFSGDFFNIKYCTYCKWSTLDWSSEDLSSSSNGHEGLGQVIQFLWDFFTVSSSVRKKGVGEYSPIFFIWNEWNNAWKRLWHHQHYINIRYSRCLKILLSSWDKATFYPSAHGFMKQPFWSHLKQVLKPQTSPKANCHPFVHIIYMLIRKTENTILIAVIP